MDDEDVAGPGDSAGAPAALVTGGGSGIGLGCARALAAAGMRVTICGRSAERLERALGTLPDGVRHVVADVTDRGAMAAAVEVAGDGGPLAAVIANAGGTSAIGSLALLDPAAFEDEMRLNVTGTLVTLQASAPALARGGGGSFVAVSSIAGGLTHRHMGAYSVSKAAVEMLVRNAADELGRYGVRVNAVRPGLVPTDASGPLADHADTRADYLAQMPLGRLGTVEDVAGAVAFLAGPGATWITGQILGVDGGHSLRRGPDLDAVMGGRASRALDAALA